MNRTCHPGSNSSGCGTRATAIATRPGRGVLDVVTDPEHRLVVLLGDPGSGKSTIGRYLMLALASESHALDRLAGHVPVLVELSALASNGTPLPADLVDVLPDSDLGNVGALLPVRPWRRAGTGRVRRPRRDFRPARPGAHAPGHCELRARVARSPYRSDLTDHRLPARRPHRGGLPALHRAGPHHEADRRLPADLAPARATRPARGGRPAPRRERCQCRDARGGGIHVAESR